MSPSTMNARELALSDPDGVNLRPEVLGFAVAMELKLREHDGTRGDRWKAEPALFFTSRMMEELVEYMNAALYGVGDPVSEAVDVGNFAMMAWWTACVDRAGGLERRS